MCLSSNAFKELPPRKTAFIFYQNLPGPVNTFCVPQRAGIFLLPDKELCRLKGDLIILSLFPELCQVHTIKILIFPTEIIKK